VLPWPSYSYHLSCPFSYHRHITIDSFHAAPSQLTRGMRSLPLQAPTFVLPWPSYSYPFNSGSYTYGSSSYSYSLGFAPSPAPTVSDC
jgi:hypothetical protein